MNITHRFQETSQFVGRPTDQAAVSEHKEEPAFDSPVTCSKVYYKAAKALDELSARNGWAKPEYKWLEASQRPEHGDYVVYRAVAQGDPGPHQHRQRELETTIADRVSLTEYFERFYDEMVKAGYSWGSPFKTGSNGMSQHGPRLKVGRSSSVAYRVKHGLPPRCA